MIQVGVFQGSPQNKHWSSAPSSGTVLVRCGCVVAAATAAVVFHPDGFDTLVDSSGSLRIKNTGTLGSSSSASSLLSSHREKIDRRQAFELLGDIQTNIFHVLCSGRNPLDGGLIGLHDCIDLLLRVHLQGPSHSLPQTARSHLPCQ